MSEPLESAHGRRSPEDVTWNGARLIGLLFVTLAISLAFLYFISAVKSGEWSWSLIDHQIGVHDVP